MSTVKRVLIHCVSETTVQKAITTRSLGLNHSWDLILSCDLQIFRCECGLRCQRGNRGTLRVQITFFRRLWPGWLTTYRHMSMLFLFLWVFISQSDCIMKLCIYLGNCSITLAPRGDGTAEGGRGRKVRPKRKHWLRDKQKPAAKWKEANPSLEKAKDREVFVDRLIQHNLPL